MDSWHSEYKRRRREAQRDINERLRRGHSHPAGQCVPEWDTKAASPEPIIKEEPCDE